MYIQYVEYQLMSFLTRIRVGSEESTFVGLRMLKHASVYFRLRENLSEFGRLRKLDHGLEQLDLLLVRNLGHPEYFNSEPMTWQGYTLRLLHMLA